MLIFRFIESDTIHCVRSLAYFISFNSHKYLACYNSSIVWQEGLEILKKPRDCKLTYNSVSRIRGLCYSKYAFCAEYLKLVNMKTSVNCTHYFKESCTALDSFSLSLSRDAWRDWHLKLHQCAPPAKTKQSWLFGIAVYATTVKIILWIHQPVNRLVLELPNVWLIQQVGTFSENGPSFALSDVTLGNWM